MNKFIIAFCASILLHTMAYSQDIHKWAAELGTSYRINKSEHLKGVGILISRSVTGNFWLQSGVFYKKQIEEFKSEITTNNNTLMNDVKLRLDYLNIPLMLRYNSKFLSLGLGTNYERYMNSKDISDTDIVNTSLSIEEDNIWYISGYVGFPIPIFKNIQIEPGVMLNYHSEKTLTDINLAFKYLF